MYTEDLPVFKETKNLASLVMKFYDSMPKTHRYRIGAKLYDTVLDLFELISGANREKANRDRYLSAFLRKFSSVQAYVVLCEENRLLPVKQVAALTKSITSISKQITAWKNTAG